jgi:hypothetical protein
MNGYVLWLEAREKYFILMQMLIEALCYLEVVVINVTTFTGGLTILIFTINNNFFYFNDSVNFLSSNAL